MRFSAKRGLKSWGVKAHILVLLLFPVCLPQTYADEPYRLQLISNGLRSGDIVFCRLGFGFENQAMAEEIPGRASQYSHIGIIWVDASGGVYVIHAYPKSQKVVQTRWADFVQSLQLSSGLAQPLGIGQIRPEHRLTAERAAAWALSKVSQPYNRLLTLDAPGFYCSQLIAEAFRVSDHSIVHFPYRPMRFGQGTANRHFWAQYFAKLGVPIPDGKEGISPMEILHEGAGRVFDHIFLGGKPSAPLLQPIAQ